MKKFSLIFVVTFFITLVVHSQSCGPSGSSGCATGGTIIPNQFAPYNCNQYSRAAFVHNKVNMGNGALKTGVSPWWIKNNVDGSPIKDDDLWIEVSDQYGQVASSGTDHSAVLLNGGIIPGVQGGGHFASTPGYNNQQLYTHGHGAFGSGECDFDYFAYMPLFQKSGSHANLQNGNNRTFSLTGTPSFVDIQWEKGPNLIQVGGSSGSSFKIKANCSGSSNISTWVKGKLVTDCTIKEFIWNFDLVCSTPVDCSGSINGNYLYTVNSVSSTSNHVHMNNSQSWTWVKTSGSVNWWSLQNSGRDMYFSINQGSSVSFNSWTNGCNLSLTFYRSYGGVLYKIQNENLASANADFVQYSIYDMSSGTLRKGRMVAGDIQSVYKNLKKGMYVLSINGKKEKILIQ